MDCFPRLLIARTMGTKLMLNGFSKKPKDHNILKSFLRLINKQILYVCLFVLFISPTEVMSQAISINPPSALVNEGNDMVFNVILSTPNPQPITLNYIISGTVDAADYNAATTSIVIPANTTSSNITISTAGDAMDEDDETVIVTLQSADNGAIISTTNSATGIILDNDAPPEITFYNPLPFNEVNGTLHFTIKLSNPSSKTIVVSFAYDAASTAIGASSQTNGVDYNNSITSVTILPGSLTASIPIVIYNDQRGEASETIILSAFNTTTPGVTFPNASATGTLRDNDGGPDVTFELVSSYFSENEGVVKVRVKLTGNITEQQVTVPYTITGTAILGSDFQITGSTSPLVFTPGTLTLEGERVKDIEITITNDAVFEPTETVIFTLGTPVNAFLGTNKVHTLTILNDETSINIQAFESVKAEGTGGTSTDFIFNVNRDPGSPIDQPINFTYIITPGSISPTQANDFVGGVFPANVAGTIPAGQSNVVIKIPVKHDGDVEQNENFTVKITPQGGVSSSGETANGTIQNDDNSVSLSFDVGTVSEGGTAKLIAKLPSVFPTNVTMNVILKGTSINGTDYIYDPTGAITLTIPANSLSSNAYTFNIVNDGVFEGSFPETLIAEITSVVTSNVAPGASASLQIIDTQISPSVSISASPSTISENPVGISTITATLSSKAAEPVTVDLSFAGTAEVDKDYSIAGSPSLVIPAGSLSATIQISAITDNVSEGLPNETVNANIISVTGGGATLNAAQSTAVLEITDNDVLPVVSITAPPNVVEGPSGTTVNLVYPFRLNRAPQVDLTINYSFDPGSTAIGGSLLTDDYDNINITVTVLAGQTAGVIIVPVRGDDVDEGVPSESVIVKLMPGTGYTVNTGSAVQAIGLIVEDDFIPVVNVSVDFYAIRESGSATVRAVLANPKIVSSIPITVELNITGTATNGLDYNNIPLPLTLTIPAYQTSSSITVDILAILDGLYEGNDELIIATISNPSANAQLGISTLQISLLSADPAPTLTVDDPVVIEGNLGTTILSFTITKSGTATANNANVEYVILIGTATTADNDFVSSSGRLTFLPNDPPKTIDITVTGDVKYENDETFSVRLQSASYSRIIKGTGVGTIINDDAMPQFSVSDITVNESVGTVALIITKTGLTELPATLTYTTTPGTAIESTDYTATTGTLTFQPNEDTKTVLVPITNDLIIESGVPETFVFSISSPSNAVIGTGTSTISILDDDNAEFYVESKSVNESAGTVTYRVYKTNNNGASIDYTVTSGSAVLDTDFTVGAITGTFSFADNDPLPYREITVTIINNTVKQPDKNFTITLTNPTNGATITPGFGVGTEIILDDDVPHPPIAIEDVYTTDSNASLIVSAVNGVLSNDYDLDNDPLIANKVTDPQKGILVFNSDGSFIYTPNHNFYGDDSFTYSNNDGTANSNIVTVKITVVPVGTLVDVAVIKEAEDKKVTANTEFDYTITASNEGVSTSTGIIVKDILPLEIEMLNYNSSVGTVNYDASTRTLTWSIDSLTIGGRETITIHVRALVAGNVTNTANAMTSEIDINLANNNSVNVKTIFGFSVPNAFSPNNDGINDLFVIPGLENLNSEVVIYNRYGDEIYRVKNYKNNWTGYGLPTGTYYYVIRLRDAQGKSENVSGGVTLIR